jgi:hypothetical protein
MVTVSSGGFSVLICGDTDGIILFYCKGEIGLCFGETVVVREYFGMLLDFDLTGIFSLLTSKRFLNVTSLDIIKK